jgi:hypothetical protein
MSGHAGNQTFIGGIKDGLVLYLDAMSSLVSSSYGLAGDNTNWYSPVGNNGTLINSPIYTGSFGGCVNFNGTNQYVSIPSGGGLNNSSAYTIEVWVKWNGIQSQSFTTIWGPICGRQYNGVNSENIIALNGANPTGSKILYQSTNGYSLVTGSSNVGLNTWNYVSIVFGSGKSNIYKNGIFENSGSGAGTFDNTGIVLSLGAWVGDGNTYASCSIGSLSVYNRALSLNEVTASYSGSKGRFGL